MRTSCIDFQQKKIITNAKFIAILIRVEGIKGAFFSTGLSSVFISNSENRI